MDEFEDKLKALPRAAPSSNLDRRMDATFSRAHDRAKDRQRRPQIWWWLAGIASAGGVAALLLVGPFRSRFGPVSSSTVYRFEAQGLMRDMLLNSNSRGTEEPHFNIQVHEP